MRNSRSFKHTAFAALISAGLTLTLAGCDSTEVEANQNEHASVLDEVTKLVAVMRPTEGNETRGVVTFTAVNGEVRVEARISGLEPGRSHAIHVHQWGDDRSADGTSTGGHYNPEGHPHGLPNDEVRHAGDLGNLLEADDEGNATLELVVDNVTLAGAHNPIIGRAVIVHEGQDMGPEAQPTGDAGARIASGIIGVANPELEG